MRLLTYSMQLFVLFWKYREREEKRERYRIIGRKREKFVTGKSSIIFKYKKKKERERKKACEGKWMREGERGGMLSIWSERFGRSREVAPIIKWVGQIGCTKCSTLSSFCLLFIYHLDTDIPIPFALAEQNEWGHAGKGLIPLFLIN